MATKDLRRRDVRTNVRINPFWIVSGEFEGNGVLNTHALFGFPLVDGNYFVHEIVVNVIEAFTVATDITDIGLTTISAAGVLAASDADTYFDPVVGTEDVLLADTIGLYPLGAMDDTVTLETTGSDWAIAKLHGTTAPGVIADLLIIGADYDVLPVVTATVAATALVGKARLHMLVSRLV